jgi:hypothetical protein
MVFELGLAAMLTCSRSNHQYLRQGYDAPCRRSTLEVFNLPFRKYPLRCSMDPVLRHRRFKSLNQSPNYSSAQAIRRFVASPHGVRSRRACIPITVPSLLRLMCTSFRAVNILDTCEQIRAAAAGAGAMYLQPLYCEQYPPLIKFKECRIHTYLMCRRVRHAGNPGR